MLCDDTPGGNFNYIYVIFISGTFKYYGFLVQY